MNSISLDIKTSINRELGVIDMNDNRECVALSSTDKECTDF